MTMTELQNNITMALAEEMGGAPDMQKSIIAQKIANSRASGMGRSRSDFIE